MKTAVNIARKPKVTNELMPRLCRAYLEEESEGRIILNLIFHPLFCNRVMSNINGICKPKLGSSVKEYVADPLDDRSLFALPDIHYF